MAPKSSLEETNEAMTSTSTCTPDHDDSDNDHDHNNDDAVPISACISSTSSLSCPSSSPIIQDTTQSQTIIPSSTSSASSPIQSQDQDQNQNQNQNQDQNQNQNQNQNQSLKFNDYIDLQTRLVLMPYVEEEGTGAIIFSYQENSKQYEGLILLSIHSGEENEEKDENEIENDYRTADFTDILSALREKPSSIILKFESPPPTSSSQSDNEEEEEEEEEEDEPMIEVDLCENKNKNIDDNDNDDDDDDKYEEKKEDDLRVVTTITELTPQKIKLTKEELMISTPKTTNRKFDNGDDDERLEPKLLFQQQQQQPTMVEVPPSPTAATKDPPMVLSKKRQPGTPSKEHTESINSALDDDHQTHHHARSLSAGSSSSLVGSINNNNNRNNNGGRINRNNGNNNSSLSSGMSALSAWGLRMKVQSEKLAANAISTMAIPNTNTNNNNNNNNSNHYSRQQRQQHKQKFSLDNDTNNGKTMSITTQPPIQLLCDMYIQTNLGLYFPISKSNYNKSSQSQLKSSITTSSLFCIRKSATEHCGCGKNGGGTSTGGDNNNKQQDYTFQWYRSSSSKTRHNNNNKRSPPVSSSELYDSGNDFNADNASIGGESTCTSGSSGDRSYASSSSSSSSVTGSSYTTSTSTAGISRHTISLASTNNNSKSKSTTNGTISTNNNTIATKDEEWIILVGATNPTFQPNTTLVGKKLRCIVTIRPCLPCPAPASSTRGLLSSNENEDGDGEDNVANTNNNIIKGNLIRIDHGGSSASLSSKDSSNASAIMNADDDYDDADADDNDDDDDTNAMANNVSLLDDDDDDHEVEEEDDEEEDGVERIICDLIVPIQADMVLFNGARQAMITRGSATFINLIGRGSRGEGVGDVTSTSMSNNTTPATATATSTTLACGKSFRIEVGAARKIITYTPSAVVASSSTSTSSSSQQQQQLPTKKKKKIVNVNLVHIYCRSSPQEEYAPLTDIPLLQVSAAVANPTNPRQVDLLFPAIPPRILKEMEDHEDGSSSRPSSSCCTSKTHQFLKDYCIVDHTSPFSLLSSSEDGEQRRTRIPRLELETPNRMTRESFLLALGIANYQGKPAQLDNKKVLYRDTEVQGVVVPQLSHVNTKTTTPNTPNIIHNNSNNSNKNTTKPFTMSLSLPPPSQQSRESSFGGCKNDDDTLSTNSGGDGPLFSSNSNNNNNNNCTMASLSPSRPSKIGGINHNDVVVRTPGGTQYHDVEEESIIAPGMADVASNSTGKPATMDDTVQVKELQRELEFLRAQLTRKDKVVTELQRQVTKSETVHHKTKQVLANTVQELKQSQQDCERIQISKRRIERSMQSQHESTQIVESNHKHVVIELERKIKKQYKKVTEIEKLNRSLQNEKAVLGATVEARESKLVKLEELQKTNAELSKQVAQHDVLRSQLKASYQRHENLQRDLESKTKAEIQCRTELESALNAVKNIKTRIQGEQEKASSCQSQLETIQKQNQQLKGERNNYKQKNESLSKEVARLCRGGRNIRDIEKLVADHESLLQETELLRIQKRKALEDAHMYRTLYEQGKAVEEMSGMEQETRHALERTTELERLLAEMTDYVTAKDMQFDTMKQVNEALQDEIHNLAQANLRSNEV